MKNLLSLLMAMALIVGSISAQTNVNQEEEKVDGPIMEFETTEIDYGVIEYNSDPYRYFNFKNTGNAPLQITHAKGSCGCTIPEYPKEPIFPGESGVIKVRYDTKRDTGKPFVKRVTVTTNEASGQPRVLTIRGTVLKRKTEAPALPSNEPSILAPDSGE